MRFFLLFFLLFSGSIAIAQPEITFDSTRYNFGTIDYAVKGEFLFGFTNTGNQPLIIAQVQGSCGCIVTTWPTEPILPGKRNVIKVKYDTKRVGPMTKTVTVSSNVPKDPQVVLTLRGTVRPQPVTGQPNESVPVVR